MRLIQSLLLLASVCLQSTTHVRRASADEWNRFRGPNGSGISDAASIPVQFSKDGCHWVVDLPGKGNSSPAGWGSRVFVTSANEQSLKRSLICLNVADGSKLWQQDIDFERYRKHKNNSYASSTPATDADHVYVLWHSKTASPLVAYTHNGQKVWEYDLGPYLHGQGGATSPIVHDNLVLVANDHKQDSFLVAVDRKTGEERWKIDREGKRACYGTPCVFAPKDRPAEVVFSHCFEGIIGVDPKTGHQNWHIDVFGRASQRALGSPVIADNLIVASSGAVGGDRQVVVVRPHASGDVVKVDEAFRIKRNAPHVPTPLVYKDWLFLWSDKGIVTCADRQTGKTVWQKRVGGNFFGSPICVGGRLYAVDLEGTVVVLKASSEYELLGRSPLDDPSRATPAVIGGRLLVRTDSRLFAVGGE